MKDEDKNRDEKKDEVPDESVAEDESEAAETMTVTGAKTVLHTTYRGRN